MHRRVPVVTQGQILEAHNRPCGKRAHRPHDAQSSAQSTVVHKTTSAPAAQITRDAALAQSTGLAFARLADSAGRVGEDIGRLGREK
jgi:hypothetical protein